jgi:hypothetical protein
VYYPNLNVKVFLSPQILSKLTVVKDKGGNVAMVLAQRNKNPEIKKELQSYGMVTKKNKIKTPKDL